MTAVGPGDVIAGRFRLDHLLGEGGMGAVWSATHTVTRKQVALKILKSDHDETASRRFLREARAASAVNHPNVVEIHDIIDHEGVPVMVLDLLTGESLGAKLIRDGRVSLGEFARIMLPVLSAIGTAHAAGIIHRDIKPDNIFLAQQPDGDVKPMVLDFGIAKLSAVEGEAAATAHLTNTGAVMGTPYYMAPEQVFGEKDIDQRADVWAMGVLCYECLAGKKPVDAANLGQLFKAIVTGNITPLGQVASDLPVEVVEAIGRMLRVKRDERASDLRELYEALKPHSNVSAISFAGPAQPVQLHTDPGITSGTNDGLVQSYTEPTIQLPITRRGWPLALAGLGLSAGVAALLFFVPRSEGINATAESASAVPAEPAAPALSITEAAPTAEAPAVSPVADVPDSGVDAPPSPARRPPTKAVAPSKPSAAPAASVAPPPKPARTAGQVVEDVPF